MLNKTLLFAAVSFSLFTGCLGDSFFLQAEPMPEASEMPASRFAHCVTMPVPERIDPNLYADAEFQHEPAPGLTVHEEVPVSPKGCVRYYQDIKDGQLVSTGVVRAAGIVEVYNTLDGSLAFREHEQFLRREVFTKTTSVLEIDEDGDGRIEVVMRGLYDSEGMVEQVITFFALSNGAVNERRTMKRIDANTIRWVEEKRISGALVITRDQVAPAVMEERIELDGDCYKPGYRKVTCTAEQHAEIQKQLKEALKKGRDCLERAKDIPDERGAKDRHVIDHLIKTRANNIVRECFEGSGKYAHIDNVEPGSDPTGPHTMGINVGLLACQSSIRIQSTLFHEMLHISRGPHGNESGDLQKLFEEGKMTREQWNVVDPMRACQTYCFEEVRNRCTCAACFQTLECDPACEKEAACDQQNQDGTWKLTQAVGALCKMPAGMESGTHWNRTLAACQATCAFGTCTSYGLACNTACN